MILSHTYRFIFIKTLKTAGTSVEVMLSPYMGADDVLTPIGGKEEKERIAAGYGPRNYKGWFNPLPLLWQGVPSRRRKAFMKILSRRRFYQHMAAYEVRSRVSNDIWNNYFTFAVERNPWDKTVSGYFFHKKTGYISSDMSFEDYVRDNIFPSNWDLYADEGGIMVDQLVQFEHLSQELSQICKRLGLPERLTLPRSKGDSRPQKADYRSCYNEETKRIIAERFVREIEAFGYEF